jgi:hypothetical protein
MITNLAELKAVVWAALELGLIPTISVVLILYFLRHNRDLRVQNEKLVHDLRKMNEKTLEMIRDLVELKVSK